MKAKDEPRYTLARDIMPGWLNVVRRLQSVARSGQSGYAILSMKVLVNADGRPVFWFDPAVTKFEPRLSAGEFIAKIAEEARE